MIISVYVNAKYAQKVESALKREYMYPGYHLSFLGQIEYNDMKCKCHFVCGLDCMGGGNGISDLTLFEFVADIRLIDEYAAFMFR